VKLLHVPFTWYPAACGGTEVYVRALMRELAEMGWESEIAVPGKVNETAMWDGVKVHRVAMADELTQEMLYGGGEPLSAQAFGGVLDVSRPDVIHFHAYSPAVSVRWLEAARVRGIPCVYTYHTPTLACGRGTLMRWGSVPCDGKMKPLRCAACSLHGMGVSKPLSWALAVTSPVTQALRERVPFRIWPLMKRRTAAVHEWLAGMSCVVALCQWGREVLERNGVSPERLRVVRHGLAGGERGGEGETGRLGDSETRRGGDAERGRRGDLETWRLGEGETERRGDSEILRVVFFGRLDRTKGLHVLVEALRLMPELKVELHCHLIRDESAEAAMHPLLCQMKSDARVHLHPPVASDEVAHTMSSYDAVVVPSIWLETGPLVVLEAFEAGVPVLGSRLGGIAEWVTHERDGLLFPPGDAEAWARGLKCLAHDSKLLTQLRAGVRQPPRMSAVARQMELIYREAAAPAQPVFAVTP
jgi:glycosyltransferase involved in cell wall biosynthesis